MVLSYLKGYPDGVYSLRFRGRGTVRFGGMGRLIGPIRASGGGDSGEVLIRHDRGDLLTMTVSDLDPNDPIRRLQLLRPGASSSPSSVFDPAFLRRIRPFRAVRAMCWTGVNTSGPVEWSERVGPDDFLATGPGGVAYEEVIALANEAGVDLWLNVPDTASDDFAQKLATLVRDRLDPRRRLYLELGNELWNHTFPQAKRVVGAAKRDPSLTRSDDFGRAGQWSARRLAEVSAIFRREFGGEAKRVLPILCGQSANPYFLRTGLELLEKQSGDVRDVLAGIAIAPYLAIDGEEDVPGMSLDALFARMNEFLDKKLSGWITVHHSLAKRFGLPMLAYEGGQHLVGWSPAARADANLEIKRAAQADRRMAILMKRMDDVWRAEDGRLFAFFTLYSSYGKSGFWGLLEGPGLPGSVKWDATLRRMLPPGDVDLDGRVTPADERIVRDHLGRAGLWREQGDLDGDGTVGPADLAIVRAGLGDASAADRPKAAPSAAR